MNWSHLTYFFNRDIYNKFRQWSCADKIAFKRFSQWCLWQGDVLHSIAIDLFLQIPLDSNRLSFFMPIRISIGPSIFSYIWFFLISPSFVFFFSHLKEKASKFAKKRKITRGIKIEMIRNIVTSPYVCNCQF